MKVRKVKLITEEAHDVNGVKFTNSTEDQFPYVEAALNSIDNNFNWWKDNWATLEQIISQQLTKALGEDSNNDVSISSRFTVFHGHDEKDTNIIWHGPAIVYSFSGTTPDVILSIKNAFGGIFRGKKIFADNDDLIVLFG